MDNLNHPLDDQNLDDCDVCLVEWKHNADANIDHIVIGKGKPGGSWQVSVKDEILNVFADSPMHAYAI